MNSKSVNQQQQQQQQQLLILEKKLNHEIATRASLEKDLLSQSSLFFRFIHKLAQVCKGIDTNLDKQLDDFCKIQPNHQNLNMIINQVNLITNVTLQVTQKNNTTIQHLHDQLLRSFKALLNIEGLTPKSTQKIHHLLLETSKNKLSILHYVPTINELLSLYDSLITDKQSVNTTENYNDDIKQQIINEIDENLIILKTNITQAIATLPLSEPHQNELVLLKEKINQSQEHENVLSHLTELFLLITKDLQKERAAAKDFLSTLSQTLSHVQEAVLSTVVTTDDAKQKNNDLNQEIKKHMSSISDDILSANSLEHLKGDIDDKLSTIKTLLQNKQSFEDNVNVVINNKLTDMAARVQQLEKESYTFQIRLKDQLAKSMLDPLTKLNNRAAFDDYFTKAMVKFYHQQYPLAIVIIDLDDFKKINDTYGHTAGDKTLQFIANTMKNMSTSDVFIGRYGGEEFVMIYSNKDQKELVNTLNKLRKKIALLPFTFKNNKVNITTSIGCTHARRDDNIHQAFERADEALYLAKEQGKNRVIYQP